MILDCLEGKVYKNDRQVKAKHIFWGLDKENPRAEIEVLPLEKIKLAVIRQALKDLINSNSAEKVLHFNIFLVISLLPIVTHVQSIKILFVLN